MNRCHLHASVHQSSRVGFLTLSYSISADSYAIAAFRSRKKVVDLLTLFVGTENEERAAGFPALELSYRSMPVATECFIPPCTLRDGR